MIDIDIEICTINDIGIEIHGSDAPPLITALNTYLSIFAKPIKKHNIKEDNKSNFVGRYICLKCERPLDGVLGSFQWGIVHGEGNCSNCGWPCRAYHRPKDGEGEIFDNVLNFILQYHPSQIIEENE